MWPTMTGGQVIEVVSFTVFTVLDWETERSITVFIIISLLTLEIVEICIRSVSESDN
jgi:hypothetical protein